MNQYTNPCLDLDNTPTFQNSFKFKKKKTLILKIFQTKLKAQIKKPKPKLRFSLQIFKHLLIFPKLHANDRRVPKGIFRSILPPDQQISKNTNSQ